MARRHRWMTLLLVATSWLTGLRANADVVTDWNVTACDIAVAAKLPTPPTSRALALVQSAVYEAVNAVTQRYPADRFQPPSARGASTEAAVAEANRGTLSRLFSAQQDAIDRAYQAAIAAIPDGEARTAGIAVGAQAASMLLAWGDQDGAATQETYRPRTAAGVYVPTTLPIVPQWPQRKPWLMTSPAQFRPGPPPALTSKTWARDYNEVREVGGKNSTRRNTEQTAIAHFWEVTLPPVFHGIVRSVATMPGREVTQNARLFAAVTQAADDALIAIMDAKYHYQFWRPITAIRNGDIDGNDATERDPSWVPLIETPMHPEYPCAHCIVSSAIGTVLHAEIGKGPTPTLTTTSDLAQYGSRSWSTIDAFVQEVGRVSTTACTTVTPRKSARRWARRSAGWPSRSICRYRRSSRRYDVDSLITMTQFVFTKGAGKTDRLEVRRDGAASEVIDCPKQGIIPHDMVHYAVESTLATRGFLSRVSSGEMADFRMAPDATSDPVERLVEVVQADAWSGSNSAPGDLVDLYGITCSARACAPLPVDSDDINRIRARIAELSRAWEATPVGGTLALSLGEA